VKLGGSLLNTKEAARVLRVSEASIRRWSDSGLLPARRIGPRRERRFELSQLEQFLGNIPDNRPAELHSSPAVTIGGASVPFRSHFAPIYSTDAGGLRLTVPFLADGLRAGQACFLAASGAVLDRYSKALRDDQAIDLGKAIESGRLVVMPGPGATVEESIANWEEKFARALATGGTSIRVVGEMACERRLFASDAAMLAYEEAYDLMTRRFPVVTLCPYDAREFGGETILRVLKAHPDTFQQHLGLFLS
jgi:transcriptional repressor of dcmA and dcmR